MNLDLLLDYLILELKRENFRYSEFLAQYLRKVLQMEIEDKTKTGPYE